MQKAFPREMLNAAVTERETKPHSARKSNKETVGYETWLSLPRGGLGLFFMFKLKRRGNGDSDPSATPHLLSLRSNC